VRLLVVGAHLDDAEIACGGTMARAVASGHEVRMLTLTHSAFNRYDGTVLRTRDQAREEAKVAAEILGVKDMEVLEYPTLDLPYDSEVIGKVEAHIDAFQPDMILTHWPHDTHQDHRRGALATLSASRWYPSLALYEPMMPAGRSYVGFRPQLYVDVSDFFERKMAALKAHASQYQKFGEAWIQAVEARSRFRGYEIGVAYAEAFEAVRMEWRLL